jgi:hypothetical protein
MPTVYVNGQRAYPISVMYRRWKPDLQEDIAGRLYPSGIAPWGWAVIEYDQGRVVEGMVQTVQRSTDGTIWLDGFVPMQRVEITAIGDRARHFKWVPLADEAVT